MHDGLAQVLGYVNTKVQAANEYLKRGKSDEASAQLRELASAARGAYTDVREAIVGLRTLPGPDRALAEVIAEYLERWKEQTGMSTQLIIDNDLRLLPGVELQVVRILQEALANVRKHAKATKVAVLLQQHEDRLIMSVEDDGVGFVSGAKGRGEFPRFGLTTMRERAESVGATLSVHSTPGVGTSIRFELPVSA
jgi:signal transduction histidine kinase